MKLYRFVFYASSFIILFAVFLPLFTLREFPDFIIAWREFLVTISPSIFLVFLLLILNHISTKAHLIYSVALFVIALVATISKAIPFLFFGLFLIGLFPLVLISQKFFAQSIDT
jgi:hypothetical protein